MEVWGEADLAPGLTTLLLGGMAWGESVRGVTCCAHVLRILRFDSLLSSFPVCCLQPKGKGKDQARAESPEKAAMKTRLADYYLNMEANKSKGHEDSKTKQRRLLVRTWVSGSGVGQGRLAGAGARGGMQYMNKGSMLQQRGLLMGHQGQGRGKGKRVGA